MDMTTSAPHGASPPYDAVSPGDLASPGDPASPGAPDSSSGPALSGTERTRVRRLSERAAADRQALYDVLDSGRICHLGVVVDGSPRVLPTGYGRDGDTLYLHGSTGAT